MCIFLRLQRTQHFPMSAFQELSHKKARGKADENIFMTRLEARDFCAVG